MLTVCWLISRLITPFTDHQLEMKRAAKVYDRFHNLVLLYDVDSALHNSVASDDKAMAS